MIARCLFLSLAALVLSTVTSAGGARRFTYVYEATTSPPGSFEIENWVTWKTARAANSGDQQVDFRHEIEFGITNRLQAAVYLADWSYLSEPGAGGDHFVYSDSALELMYNLSNPVTDPIGLAVYEEIKAGNRLFELESKVIAQKNFGPFVAAYNATLEAIWEGQHLEEREGEFQQSVGISYEASPKFSVGAEVVHEIEMPDWSHGEPSVVFGGPNVSFRAGKWWATVTGLAQLTDNEEEPDVQLRTIFGYSF
jgi:hypothetical protein